MPNSYFSVIATASKNGQIIHFTQFQSPNTIVVAENRHTADLIIKAQVKPKDRQRIDVGQLVKVKINACPHPDYGILTGKVNNISADTIKLSENEPVNYTLDVVPNTSTLIQNHNTCPLQLGMTADVSIVTKAETPLQFLLRQSRLIRD